MKITKYIFLSLISIFLFSCSNNEKDKIIIFASSSLKNPLTKLCNNYKAETGKKSECTFNSSGRLREKIESGFYADIYFSASFMEVNKLRAPQSSL